MLLSNSRSFSLLQRVIDPICLLLLLAYPIYGIPLVYSSTILAYAFCLLYVVFVFPIFHLYESYRQRSLFSLLRRISYALISFLYFLKLSIDLFPPTSVLHAKQIYLAVLLSWIALVLNHILPRSLLRRYRSLGKNSRSILFYGSSQDYALFSSELTNRPWLGLHVTAWFSSCDDDQLLPSCIGTLSDIPTWLETNSVDRIIFSYLPPSTDERSQLLRLFGDYPIPVSYFPAWTLPSMHLCATQIDSFPLISLWGGSSLSIDFTLKSLFDSLLSFCLLIFLSPLLILISLLILLIDKSPPIFTQLRCGLDGKPFNIYKFRTMRDHIVYGNEIVQATRNDIRITKLGKILRSTSLDELPQLFNILKRDMSFVGPRPHAVEHDQIYRKLVTGYMQRFTFRPGLTGLAQVQGLRGETDIDLMTRRIQLDLEYQSRWSLKLDLKIIIKTLFALTGKRAY